MQTQKAGETREKTADRPSESGSQAAELRQQRRRARPVDVEVSAVPEKHTANTGDGKPKHRFHLQPWREISWLRRILMIVSGALFVWSAAPMAFYICNIGVVVSSALMLFVFVTALLWHLVEERSSVKTGVICTAVGLVFTAGLLAFCFVSGLMLKASMTEVPEDSPNYTVVVLGCLIHDDQPSWMLSDRLEVAYRVLTDNPDVMCVVSGGQGDNENYSEAYVMRKYLVEKGISPSRIIVEEASGNTEENLLYTKNAIELNGLSKNIVIVTDRFHELRARIWAEKAGFENIYAACCETRPYLVVGYWFREMFGLARLYVFGR